MLCHCIGKSLIYIHVIPAIDMYYKHGSYIQYILVKYDITTWLFANN